MSKGAETRDRIVDRALRLASRDGLGGLSIGTLATELGLSKSGLFAHFGSKEDLQLAVLREAIQRFETTVIRPALTAPRGEPRVRAMFENWLAWLNDPANLGGCILVAASIELDDQEGRPRDLLAASQKQLVVTLARAARIAVEAGHFRPELDCDQFAFDWQAAILACEHWRRLIRATDAELRTRASFDALVAAARIRS